MPAWLFLSSEPRFAFITMILTYLSYAIGLSNLSLNINNKNLTKTGTMRTKDAGR